MKAPRALRLEVLGHTARQRHDAHKRLVVIAVTGLNEQSESWSADHELSVDQLARQQGVKPIASVDELAQPGLFESDEEYEALLSDLYTSRRSDVA